MHFFAKFAYLTDSSLLRINVVSSSIIFNALYHILFISTAFPFLGVTTKSPILASIQVFCICSVPEEIRQSLSIYILFPSISILFWYAFIILTKDGYMFLFTHSYSCVYSKNFFTSSNSKSDASALLYSGLESYPEYPFGTRPYFISLMQVSNTSLASANLLVFSKIPSKAISVSLPQSKNQGYPAISVYSAKEGLYTTKLSVAIIKFLTKLLYSSSFASLFFSFKISVLYIIELNLTISLLIKSLASISSMFCSSEHTNVTYLLSLGSISISYTPGTT